MMKNKQTCLRNLGLILFGRLRDRKKEKEEKGNVIKHLTIVQEIKFLYNFNLVYL